MNRDCLRDRLLSRWGQASRRRRGERFLRPRIEALEDRRLLSTFTVESIADSAPASSPAQGTLRWAVAEANAANTPSTINFNLGSSAAVITLSQGQLVLTNTGDSTTILGPGASLLSISGNDSSRVLQIDKGVTASISGLTITEGSVGGLSFGGGLYNDGGTVTLDDCKMSDNYADFGGGLENYSGTAMLNDCTITGNSAAEGGGAGLENHFFGTLDLTDCTISGNSAAGGAPGGNSGGGLTNRGMATLVYCAISGNSAANGGGLFNQGTVSVSHCTISNNTASEGGGLDSSPGVEGTGATLTDCTISGNSSDDGGGVENGSDSLTMTGCTVSGNYAYLQGGGVDNYNSGASTTASLTGCTITGNNTSTNTNAGEVGLLFGGGVVNRSKSKMTLTDCAINDNSSYSAGGLSNDGTVTLSGCTISGNSAVGEFGDGGGGLDDGRYSSATLANCTISDNTAIAAVDGGGGGLRNGSTIALALTGCTISGNSGQNGGGISGSATLADCTLSGNSAYFGGGIDGTATITDCTISGNSAQYGGGISGSVKLTDTIVAGNTATSNSDINGAATGSSNLIGTGGSGGLSSSDNLLDVTAPLLSPPGSYGGPTQTIALLPGSPAIGAGTGVSTVITDQRGAPRPTSGPTDIGAFQDQGYSLVVSSGSGQTATVGQAFAAPLAAMLTEDFVGAPVPGATISFSAPATGASATLSAGTAVTDANGLASVIAKANGSVGSYAVDAAANSVAPAASFTLTNATAGPINVTDDLSVKSGGFVYNRAKRQFTQVLTVTNISDSAINGPIELVLVNLKNATLANQSGVTQGSPYITVIGSGSLGVGHSETIMLVFADPTLATITYTPEFLAGPIPPTAT